MGFDGNEKQVVLRRSLGYTITRLGNDVQEIMDS